MVVNEETYLGDGLYVSYDGWQVKLRAPRIEGDHEVYLEPQTINDFILWLEKSGIIRKR